MILIDSLANINKKVFINDKETTETIFSNNKLYVSVNSLKNAGALVNITENRVDIKFDPIAGKYQEDRLEGYLQEWLNNEFWRVYVHSAEKVTNYKSYKVAILVTIEIRNISKGTKSLHSTGLDSFIVLDDKGTKIKCIADKEYEKLFYSSIVQADGVKATLTFADIYNKLEPENVGNLDKLIIEFRPSGGKSALKGFRIFLKNR